MTDGSESGNPPQGGSPYGPQGYVPPPGYGPVPPGYGAYGAYGGYGGYGGGPYGGYGPYGAPPAPKPGIIPLRPLSVSEILSGAVSAIRWNPATILGASAIVSAVSGVLLSLVLVAMPHAVIEPGGIGGQQAAVGITPHQLGRVLATVAILAGVTLIVTVVTNILLTGVLTTAIGEAVLGRKPSLGAALRATWPRIGALLATVLLEGVLIAAGWVAAVTLSVVAALALAKVAHLVAVGILVGIVCVLGVTAFAMIVWVRWSLAVPVVMLEHASPLASLGRSWRLVQRSMWRIFGITALAQVIVAVVGGMIREPFSVAGGASALFASIAHPTAASLITSGLGGIVAGAVTTPVLAGVVVLLYTDMRMRKEGIAAILQSAAASPGGQGAATWYRGR
jgi:hypothetical protein